MPRKARIDAPGALHHIIVRGIERRKIFRDDSDRTDFLERLGNIVSDTLTQCFAFSLIPNHIHLLLRTGNVPIATVMRRLLTGYAVKFNRRYHRHGQLFQNRYKSILCQEDIYLKELIRYIHLNPLRAGLVSDMKALDKYPWCGHNIIMKRKGNGWQNIDYVLGLFSETKQSARSQYRNYIQKGIAEGQRKDLTGGGLIRSTGGWSAIKSFRKAGIRVKGDERILGDSDFVEQVLEAAQESFARKHILKAEGYDFDAVIRRVSEVLDIKSEKILRPNKQPQTVKARSLLCYWCNRELGLSTVDIANTLNIGQPAVSRAILRGERIARENQFEFLTRKA
jgi:REP element-mobilizing transposase RayT